MRQLMVGVLLVLLVGCTDQAEGDYARCIQLDVAGDSGAAMAACSAAVAADPKSASGRGAAAKLADIKTREPRLEAGAPVAQAAPAKAQAEEASCARWSTICTLGRWPDGSERTSGIQSFDSKADCEHLRTTFATPCDPCQCRQPRAPPPSATASAAPTATNDNDGTDAKRPVLPSSDDGFVDSRGGWGWGDKCYLNIKGQKWGWAKAECDEGMRLNPASPTPRAGLLYNEGLIAKAAGNIAEARQDFTESLALREHPAVRAALDSLSASSPSSAVSAATGTPRCGHCNGDLVCEMNCKGLGDAPPASTGTASPTPQAGKGPDCGCKGDLMCLMKCSRR